MEIKKAQIGVIGLAVMGANLARNFASRGIKTAVFNRTYARTTELLEQHGENLFGHEKLSDFVASLEKPRRIIIMVQAGAAVDEVLKSLDEFLEAGDFVIDGGNSFYLDTERRFSEQSAKGVNFLGMGISGGEEGALHGPSLMPGLSKSDWPKFADLLQSISAKDFSGEACVAPLGKGGAGHFVKMVHNGIEYAIMQLIAEIYDFNRKATGLQADEIAKIFAGVPVEAGSFLTEITVKVLSHKVAEGSLVDLILDKAAQKGTGGWTAIEAIKTGVPAGMIGEAVNARTISSMKEARLKMDGAVKRSFEKSAAQIDWSKVILFGSLISYAQGLMLIESAAKQHGWEVDLDEVCRIWQGGCIIRSRLLVSLAQTINKKGWWGELVKDNDVEMQKFLLETLRCKVAAPASSSAYNFWLGITDAQSPANLIQGLRDFFGAHTFERVDKEGVFHEIWPQ